MTDIEKLKELLTGFKIPFEVESKEQEVAVTKEFKDGWKHTYGMASFVLTIAEGVGYGGFVAIFNFDKDGKFLSHGVYE